MIIEKEVITMTIQKMIDELVEAKIAKVPIVLEDVELGVPIYEPRYSEVKSFISFQSTTEGLFIKAPYLDESEGSKKRFTNQLDIERDDLLGKGFAAKIKSTFRTEPGGLVFIEHKGIKIQRKRNDYRYNDFRELYNEVAYFMFDVSKGQYVQCRSNELRKAEHLIRTMTLEELEAQGKFDPSTIEFISRKELNNSKLMQLQSVFEMYRDQLYEMLLNERNLVLSSKESVDDYLKNIRSFLKEVYKPLSGLYFVFNRIDEGEYIFHEKTLREAYTRFDDLTVFYNENKNEIFSGFAAKTRYEFASKIKYFSKLFQYKKTTSEDDAMGYFVEELKRGNAHRTLIQIDAEGIYYPKDGTSSEFIQAEHKAALIKKYKV